MTKTLNEDGTTDLYAEGEMRLRVKGSDDAEHPHGDLDRIQIDGRIMPIR